MQYKGATKITFLAHFAFGQFLKNKLKRMHFPSTTKMCFKGGSRYFSAFAKGFEADKKKFPISIVDITVTPLNGCRLPKKRRV
jgi:ribosomal protein S11